MYRRLEAVALLGEGKTSTEVSAIVKYHEKYVRILECKFCEQGPDAFAIDGQKGGNHQLMTSEKADAFLEQFKEAAKNGQVITIEEIAAAFDKETGKTRKSLSTVYSFYPP